MVVNGNPFYEFGHRLPLQLVTHLQVEGDVELQSINFIGGTQPLGQVCGVSLPVCPLPSVIHSHLRLFPGHLLRGSPFASWATDPKATNSPLGRQTFHWMVLGASG